MSRRLLAAAALAGLLAAPVQAAPRPQRLAAVGVRAKAPAFLAVELRLPKGRSLDQDTALRWRITETYAGFQYTAKRKDKLLPPVTRWRIPFSAEPADTGVRLFVEFRTCRGQDCRDEAADYLVVLKPSLKEKRGEVPVVVKVAE